MSFKFAMTREAFRAEFFEQKPLLTRGAFAALPSSWPLIDQALDLQDPTRESLKVMHRGRVEPSEYVEEYVDVGLRRRRILKSKLYRMVSEGATLVLNRIELVSPPVRAICLEIGRFVGAQTTANAYASLGEEPATNVHWDTHDVFVVQIGGCKRWRVYEPTHPLPISNQISNDRKAELPAKPVLDEVLEAGDIIYVPRGWWHKVEPTNNCETVHLTVAVHTPLILDYLVWACATVLPDSLEMRYSLLGDGHDEGRVADAAAAAVEKLTDPANLRAFYAKSQQRERVVSPFNIEGLVSRTSLPLKSTTTVMLNARYPDSQKSTVLVNGEKVELDGDRKQIVGILASTTVADVAFLRGQLPHLSSSTVDHLLRELASVDVISLRPGETISAVPARAVA